MVVLFGIAHVQDGREEFAKLYGTVEEALKEIEDAEERKYGCQYEWHLYEVGREIPLDFVPETAEEIVKKTKLKVKIKE